MRSRDFIKAAGGLFLLAGATPWPEFFATAADAPPSNGRPLNILFVTADDMNGSKPGWMGNPLKPTPNMDAFAKSAHRFTQNHDAAPICQPSRSAMMTGLWPHRSGGLGFNSLNDGVLAELTRGEVLFIGEHARVYLRDVQDHLNRVVETIEIYRDLVLGARDIYLSSISNHLNQIMKTLTIITVVALPFTIVTGFFGMNFEAVPGLHSKLGFWLATGGMFGAMMGLLYLFKVKKWI